MGERVDQRVVGAMRHVVHVLHTDDVTDAAAFATAAAPAYLDRRGRPQHPRELLSHACLPGRFSNGALAPWEFERDGEVVQIDPAGPLVVNVGAGTDLIVDAAVAGTGIIYLFEDWLRPHLQSGALEPVIKPWWLRFSGPFLYYPGGAWCRRRCAPSSTSSKHCRLTAPELGAAAALSIG